MEFYQKPIKRSMGELRTDMAAADPADPLYLQCTATSAVHDAALYRLGPDVSGEKKFLWL